MTDAPTWLAHVRAMVARCQAHQDELFYRMALPGWLAELESLERGDDLTAETPIDEHCISHLKGQRT